MTPRAVLLSVLLLAGCTGEAETGPVPVALGEDACASCRMIVSEAPHAAQARFGPGEVEKFDDPGCLVSRLLAAGTAIELWVVDAGSGKWIDARTAFYARSDEIRTPMASGLAPFSSRADAEALAARKKGRVLTFDEVRGLERPRCCPDEGS